jgi:HSP20 family protein
VSEPQPEQAQQAERRRMNKQRALNALVFLLAAAVCVQAYVLWETNERLSATVAELDRVKQKADSSDWRVIPKPEDPGGSAAPSSDPQSQSILPPIDPFAQLDSRGWDPISDFEKMRREMDRLMGRMQSGNTIAPQVGGMSHGLGVTHQMSVDNQGESYVIKAILPGVDAADIKVRVEDQLLTISIRQEQSVDDKQGGRAMRQQRRSGAVTQRVTLPESVDGAGMKTSFKDGVLTITIPKAGRASTGSNSDPSQSVRD